MVLPQEQQQQSPEATTTAMTTTTNNSTNDASSSQQNNEQQQQQQQQQQLHQVDDKKNEEKKKERKNGNNIILNKTRVRDALGYVGTVVYVGPVASAKDLSVQYAGIVWDDTSRGKHNGTVVCRRTNQLVRHFNCCKHHPTAASFIKLSKLDTGRLLTPQLVQERYVPLDSEECVAPGQLLPHTAQTASGRNDKPIELLGEYQIRRHLQVSELHHLSLRRQGICGIDTTTATADDWSSLFQQEKNDDDTNTNTNTISPLTHLDLAGNLLSDWQSVGEILSVAALSASLDTLNLSWNRLGNLVDDDDSSTTTLPHNSKLANVNLQATNIQTLDTLINIGKSWTHLQEVGLAKCNFSKICQKEEQSKSSAEESSTTNNTTSPPTSIIDISSNTVQRRYQTQLAQHLVHVQRLDLSSCQLHSAEQVLVFARLPHLESLSLDDNPIDRLPCRTCCDGSESACSSSSSSSSSSTSCLFPALQHLQLAGTQIADWKTGLDDFFLGCPACRRANTTTTSTSTTPTPPPPPLQSLRLRSTPLSERLGTAATRVTLIARYGSLAVVSSSSSSSTTATTEKAPKKAALSVINATVVTDRERLQAERRYVTTMSRALAQKQRDAKQELQSRGGSENKEEEEMMINDKIQTDFYQEHPMLPMLQECHQTAAVCGNNGSGAGTAGGAGGALLADSIISVRMQSMTAASCEKPPLIRRLPVTLTILQVKTMLARHFGLDVDLQQLTFVAGTSVEKAEAVATSTERSATATTTPSPSNASGLLPTVLGDDEATLGYFGVDDGAVIYMHEVDVTERQAQQTREKAAFDSKLQQQQADWEARLGSEQEKKKKKQQQEQRVTAP